MGEFSIFVKIEFFQTFAGGWKWHPERKRIKEGQKRANATFEP
jgi:hypothetical protein